MTPSSARPSSSPWPRVRRSSRSRASSKTAGFDDVDVEIRQTTLPFDSGRAFVEDPVSRLQIVPELKNLLAREDLKKPLEYVRDAIDKYWAEGKLELTLNVGCASARVPD